MKRLLAYSRLRLKGFSVAKAWSLSAFGNGLSLLDKALLAAWLCFILGAVMYFNEAEEEERYSHALVRMWASDLAAKRYELVLLGCLNASDISINKVNHECLIRPYK